MSKLGKNSFIFENVFLENSSVVVGPLEGKGPIAEYFDKIYDDLYCNSKSWEKAEQTILKDSLRILLDKAKLTEKDIDFLISGDLINQNIISNYVARDYQIPMFGIYGACSTSIEGLILASTLVDSNFANRVIASTSSHNATAERQYRYPTEYGGQKPDTATYTVTGAGSALVSNIKSKIRITGATVGRVIDAKEKDPLDMGSAMAPAASETIKQHLEDFNIKPDYYDLIATGDLSSIGKNILVDFLSEQNIDISANHNDCGLIIYDTKKQPVFAGGSGCGCCASVSYSYIKENLEMGTYKRVLIVATGALMNPIIMQQKESIPAIAHAISLEGVM